MPSAITMNKSSPIKKSSKLTTARKSLLNDHENDAKSMKRRQSTYSSTTINGKKPRATKSIHPGVNQETSLPSNSLDLQSSVLPTVNDDGTCNCIGCSRERCNKCTLCDHSGFLFNSCVFKTCYVKHNVEEEHRNLKEIDAMLSASDTLEIGSKVYAAWNKSDPKSGWYWGHITRKTYTKTSKKYIVSITFDDGDKKQNIDLDDVWSEHKFLLLREKLRLETLLQPPESAPPPPTHALMIQKSHETVNGTGDMDKMVCPSGGALDVCDFFLTNGSIPKERDEDSRKSRASARNLVNYRDLAGLSRPACSDLADEDHVKKERVEMNDALQRSITSQNSLRNETITSVSVTEGHTAKGNATASSPADLGVLEVALPIVSHKTEVLDLDQQVTTLPVCTSTKEPQIVSDDVLTSASIPSKIVISPWWQRPCLRCTNCRREKCRKCFICTSSSSDLNSNKGEAIDEWDAHKCYQKMCLKIPEDQKLQKAPFFPAGWKFGFVKVGTRNTIFHGLLIVAPNDKDKRFRTVGSALKYMIARKDESRQLVDSKRFYKHVGLEGVVDNASLDSKNNNNGNESASCNYSDSAIFPSSSFGDPVIVPSNDKLHLYSNIKKVGARVYAKFTNNEWYWGTITKILQNGSSRGCLKYSILYDDGDSVINLTADRLLTEKEYFDISKMPPPPPPSSGRNVVEVRHSFPVEGERVSFSLTELFQLRCRTCVACRIKDCGNCMACLYNKLSTSRTRQVCLFKMCDAIPPSEKAQPVPFLYAGWNFFFSNETNKACIDVRSKSNLSVQKALTGLYLVSPDGKKLYRSIEDSVRECKFTKDESNQKIHHFYEKVLGLPARREKSNHPLIGHGYHREWVDGTGRPREAYGEIVKCWESITVDNVSAELHFSIRYDPEIRSFINSTSICQLKLPEIDDKVADHIAWGGFLSYSKKVKMSALDQMVVRNASFHFSWVVPTMRYNQHSNDSEFPALVMVTRGFKFALEARPSSIPNSGLGLWIKCTPASNIVARNVPVFELNPGEAVDLGVYAPTDNIDRRPEHVNLLKAFIHKWDCESWCFEMVHHHRGNDIFDITDDITGDLHDIAKKNILVYANETDGKEASTLFAEHDPEGSVHYYMGHREDIHGVFRLPTNGEWTELKVDYGPMYENVRVRKGYSRLSPFDAEIVQQKLKDDDAEVLNEIQEFSAKDLFDVIVFLEKLETSPVKLKSEKLIRALIVSVSLHKRVASILHEFALRPSTQTSLSVPESNGSNEFNNNFCDNGFTDMRQKKAFERSRKLVVGFLEQFETTDEMKNCLCAEPMFLPFICNFLTADSLESITSESIKQQLLSAHELKEA